MSIRLPVVPLHYGFSGQAWPSGNYWLVEYVRPDAPRLFWCDAENSQGQTGWAYLPEMAAGFANYEAALFAFKQRGKVPVDGGEIIVCEHIWSDAP